MAPARADRGPNLSRGFVGGGHPEQRRTLRHGRVDEAWLDIRHCDRQFPVHGTLSQAFESPVIQDILQRQIGRLSPRIKVAG
jgi:hypothetical protein